MKYALLALIWLTWCYVHSVLISLTVTGYLKHRLGDRFRYYRVVYNGLALSTLIPVALYAYSIRSEPLFSWEGYWRIGQVLLLAASLFLFVAGGRHYDGLTFLGLRQLRDRSSCTGLTETCELNTRGVLGAVRHPWYAGGLLLIWAQKMDPPLFIMSLVLSVYFVIGALLEERKLTRIYGQVYRDYQQEVSMFFPFKWIKKKFDGRPSP